MTMLNTNTLKELQNKILEIMVFIDELCRENQIEYYIMGGTALGAVRHGGFIPWDDDLDIFMTPSNYNRFKSIFLERNCDKYVLQEWSITENYLEYAKIRMNGTTFIEESFENRKGMHHGIYIDIMILHKCPTNKVTQRLIYYESKFVTLVALSQRNWRPKTWYHALALNVIKFLPLKTLSNSFYKRIYKYKELSENFDYCYWITKANFHQGIFPKEIFIHPIDIEFENAILMGPAKIKKYLEIRYGNYLKLPPLEQQKIAVHALIYDVNNDYSKYIYNNE